MDGLAVFGSRISDLGVLLTILVFSVSGYRFSISDLVFLFKNSDSDFQLPVFSGRLADLAAGKQVQRSTIFKFRLSVFGVGFKLPFSVF